MTNADRIAVVAIALGTFLMTVGCATLVFSSGDIGAWIAFGGFVLATGAIVRVIWLR